MIYYVVVFLISLWATSMANKHYHNKSAYFIFSLFATLPPIFLAGLRASSVGCDTEGYVDGIFNVALSTNDFGILRERKEDIELLYLGLNYLATRFTNNPVFVQTFAHILIIYPVYKTSMLWRKDFSPVFVMFIFYCVCYQESLSTVRHFIALSFSLLAITYCIKRKYFKFAFLTITSLGFHHSAIMSLISPILLFLLGKYPIKQYVLLYVSLFLILVVAILRLDAVIVMFLMSDLLPAKYAIYSPTYSDFDQSLGMSNLIIKTLTCFYIFLIVLRFKTNKLIDLFFFVALLDMVLSFASLIVTPLARLAYYFRMISCVSIPYVLNKYPLIITWGVRRVKMPGELVYIVILTFFWYYVYMSGNMGGTAEYFLYND